MTARIKRRGLLLVSTTLIALSACSTTTYESYRPVQNRNVDIAYVGANADFSKYRRLLPEEMGIFYPTDAAPSAADLDRVRQAFRNAFAEQIKGYEIASKPGSDVLQVKATLVDLTNATAADLPDIGDDINAILRPGKLTFMIEMRDSSSGDLLLRAADTEKSPTIDLPDDGSANSDEIKAAAEHWARLFRNFLDQNLQI